MKNKECATCGHFTKIHFGPKYSLCGGCNNRECQHKETVEGWEKEFSPKGRFSNIWLYTDLKKLIELLEFIKNLLVLQEKQNQTKFVLRDKQLREKVGMLRQWLNEDRITDPDKMVTNEQIEYWLDLQGGVQK